MSQSIGDPLVVEILVDGLEGRGPSVECSLLSGPNYIESADVREIWVTDGCILTPALTGDTRIDLHWAGQPDRGLDWCVEADGECTPELVIGSSPDLTSFEVMTPLPTDGAWYPKGVVTITATWVPGGNRPAEVIASYPVSLDVDRLARYRDASPSPLDCDGSLGGLDSGEVPTDAVIANGSCRISAPPFGLAQMCLKWDSEDERAASIAWVLHEPEPAQSLTDGGTCVLVDASAGTVTTGFATAERLANEEWQTTGEVVATLSWMPSGTNEWLVGESSPIDSATLSVDIRLLRQSDTTAALILALLLALVAAAVTYGGLYASLRWQDQLPDPNRLLYTEETFKLGRGPTGRLKAANLNWSPEVAGLHPVRGDQGHRKYLKVGSVEVRARTAKFWNIRRLMNGGWGETSRVGWLVHANPAARLAGSVPLVFDQLTLVAIDLKSSREAPTCTISLVVPSGPGGGIEAVRKLLVRVPRVVEEATDSYTASLDTTADPDTTGGKPGETGGSGPDGGSPPPLPGGTPPPPLPGGTP
ncbi:MAG: hypothetical protein VCC04_02195, partial [Myxococcota bacterium]